MDQTRVKKIITQLNHEYQDAKFSPWLICKTKNSYSIKRTVTPKNCPSTKRTFQHFPISFYKSFRDDYEKLDQFVRRINYRLSKIEEEASEKFVIKSSFVPPEILKSFKEYMETNIPSKSVAIFKYKYVMDFLLFFDNKSPNPLEWYEHYQSLWAEHLLSKNQSVATLKNRINTANRFMKYLHERMPKEVPLLIFKPLSKSVLNKIKAEKELIGEGSEKRKYISHDEFTIIKDHLSSSILPVFLLAYFYGLRRGEVLGLYKDTQRLKKGYLFIDRQIDYINENKIETCPTKGRNRRKINHWFCSAEDCYKLISSLCLLTKDHTTRKFDREITKIYDQKLIGHKYVLHDCRHTWISNAVKTHPINDVSRAAGHSDISVTNSYLKDTRELDDEVFIPT